MRATEGGKLGSGAAWKRDADVERLSPMFSLDIRKPRIFLGLNASVRKTGMTGPAPRSDLWHRAAAGIRVKFEHQPPEGFCLKCLNQFGIRLPPGWAMRPGKCRR